MDKQKFFDETVAHLRKQNEKAKDVGCRYRLVTDRGTLSCAAGGLIPDDLYEEAMEGHTIIRVLRLFYDLNTNWVKRFGDLSDSSSQYFIEELQQVHDFYPVVTWEERFQIIAKDHNLTYTAP